MENKYKIPNLPLGIELEDKKILKQLALSSRLLGELKGAADKIPNKAILISALTLMEAKESSEVENIVTTHDELYKADLNVKEYAISSSAKEVLNYREAIMVGFELIKKQGVLTNNTIKSIQKTLEGNTAGFRSVPGTTLKNNRKEIIYTPPQSKEEIELLMQNFELFLNDDKLSDLDDLVKMAILHHQFESIHPFYDGNGRTGRILCILYLVSKGLLELPILYLSRYITQNKTEYYRLLQNVRDKKENESEWKDWIFFMLKGVELTALNTLLLVKEITKLMVEYKPQLKQLFGKTYKHELINNLFFYPYTKVEYMGRDIMVQRKTAAKYLDMIANIGLLDKVKIGKTNYYINSRLINLFLKHQSDIINHIEPIDSVNLN